MDEHAADRPARAVGREAELAAMEAFVEGGHEARALVLVGAPGIGKTTLWEAGLAAARAGGVRVLRARPSGAEARLAYSTLIDLLDGVADDELEALPPPQRRALAVATLRADVAGRPPEPGAVGVGLLGVLRRLSGRRPLLVAVDDLQWLDAPSGDALAFAVRRLEGEAVRLLLARRPGEPTPLERALERRGVEPLEVRPLTLGATRKLLSARLGLALSRHVLRRLYETTLGNPLFALELGRSLARRGPLEPGEDMHVPERVEDLLGTRVAALPEPARRLLLALALGGDLRAAEATTVAGSGALEAALDAGVVVAEDERLRASHPLLAALARERSTAAERREVHFRLAEQARDGELRALHLAFAAAGPDDALAAALGEAAIAASARGAAQDAAVLAEHAVRLTPDGAPSRVDRLFALAEHLDVAGDPGRVTELLTPLLPSLPPGPLRARAHLLLSAGAVSVLDGLDHLEHALAESSGDSALRARALAKRAIICAATRVERIADAEAWALEALAAAPADDPDVERLALHGLAWSRSLSGRPIDDLAERFRASSDSAFHIADSLERVVGARLAWRGQTAEARALLQAMIAVADSREEPWSSAVLRLNLCDLAVRCGQWATASRLLDEWRESADRALLAGGPFYERCQAMLALGRGDHAAVERWADTAVEAAETSGERWSQLVALRARGIAALLAHEPSRAADSLRRVWTHLEREGVEDPGAHPVAADLVEALVSLGELEAAQAVTGRLRELAERQEHPWGLAAAARCEALLRLVAQPYDDRAAQAMNESADAYRVLGLAFDRARTLLVLGRVQRRHRKWGAARASLEQAAAAFSAMGSPGWVEAARGELARVGARRPRAAGELTEAERRAVALAAEGLSNKEIARALAVAIPTVETHLSRAYAKLGVRSRSQLAKRLAAPDGIG